MQGVVEIHLGLQRSAAGVETLVVLKRLTREMAQEQRLADELLEEARIAGQLAHVNIAQVFDVGEDEGSYFFAMEHVHGKSLRSVLRALDDRGGVLPVEHALHIAIQLCMALSHAHEHKDIRDKRLDIVHGALSPDNVFVTFAGDVKVTEFGLLASKKWAADPALVAYPAPEQSRGEPPDPRTDLYALGMLLLELTTGKAPVYRPPEFAPGYPPKLAAILLQAAARRRTHRHQSATELLAQLDMFAKKSGMRMSPAAFAKFLRTLFPDAEAQIVRERREAKIFTREEAETIPDMRQPALTLDEPTIELPPVSAKLESELELAGLRPLTTAPPAVRTWRPQADSSSGRWAVVGTAFVVGVILGLFAGSLGHDQAQPSSSVASSAILPPSTLAAAPVVSMTTPPLDDTGRGALEVQSDPAGANVFVEGELMGEPTPTTLRRLPLGRLLHVRVSRAGFDAYSAEVTLTPQRPRERVAAHLAPATFTLHLGIDAPDTALWVDGKFSSSRTIPGLAVDQDHKIAISAPGRIGKIVMFRSEQGGEKRLDLKLDPVRNSR
jgi:serine/threonine-protein kinase